jgi:hypothetical protein
LTGGCVCVGVFTCAGASVLAALGFGCCFCAAAAQKNASGIISAAASFL